MQLPGPEKNFPLFSMPLHFFTHFSHFPLDAVQSLPHIRNRRAMLAHHKQRNGTMKQAKMTHQDFHCLKMAVHFIERDQTEEAKAELAKMTDRGFELLGQAMKQRKAQRQING
jgi:hypothetical protein